MTEPDRSESVIIDINQSLDNCSIKEFMASVTDSLSIAKNEICLDFHSCESIDSFGIGALVSSAQLLHQKNIKLILRNLNPKLYRKFTDSSLTNYFFIDNEGEMKEPTSNLFEDSADNRLVIDKQINGKVAVFLMKGAMNHPTGSRYFKQQFLLSLVHCNLILLDMEELTFFDSLSVGTLINMNSLLTKSGGFLHICGAKSIISDLLKTLCIDAIIPVFDNQKEALESWGMKLV